jgi:hypothetical protein
MEPNNFSGLFLKKTLILFLLAVCSISNPLGAQQNDEYVKSVLGNKIFPFITFLREDPNVMTIIQKDVNLKKQGLQHKVRIEIALEQCQDVTCYASVLQWNPEEIVTIGDYLILLNQNSKDFQKLVSSLKTSGYYNLSLLKPDTTFLRDAWNSVAIGVNKVLDVYIKSKKPSYANIDSISFSRNDAKFRSEVHNMLANEVKKSGDKAFFEIPVDLAIDALMINNRDEAARYEPLNKGMNATAFENLKNIKWDKYQYSMMLIPGEGPEKAGVVIDSLGIVRCKLAAESYNKGLAPLIVVSGGHVHPYKTPYCEAVEMKKYLVKELNIPENVIIIEPHARHTTTNMRNAARIVYRFGIPADKKIAVVTNSNQNRFLLGMERRFMTELNCVPYRELKKVNEELSEYYPDRNALQCNSIDPLDP